MKMNNYIIVGVRALQSTIFDKHIRISALREIKAKANTCHKAEKGRQGETEGETQLMCMCVCVGLRYVLQYLWTEVERFVDYAGEILSGNGFSAEEFMQWMRRVKTSRKLSNGHKRRNMSSRFKK